MIFKSGPGKGSEGKIRFEALLFAFFAAMAICWFTPVSNIGHRSSPLGGGHFPLAPFFLLMVLTFLVILVKRISGARILTGSELLLCWALCTVVSGIAYTGLVRTFFINLTVPIRFATVENGWEDVLLPIAPPALYPGDREAVNLLYEGLAGGREMGFAELFARVPWFSWLRPVGVWSIFILLCYFTMICIVSLLSRQPLYNERMNFPLLRVPILFADAVDQKEGQLFYKNRYFLAGLLIPLLLHLINGLHFYFPQVPGIPTLILAGPYFPKHGLFSGFVKLKIFIYPAFIGFAFLVSKPISLSFWGFFLAGGLFAGFLPFIGLNIPAASLGVTFGPTVSRPEEAQMLGAYAVCFLFLFWLAKRHLFKIVKQGLGIESPEIAPSDWLGVRTAFWGWVAGSTGIILWLVWFGMTPMAAFFFICASFMVLLVAVRIICQGGVGYFTLTLAPLDGLLALFGPGFFSKTSLFLAGVSQKVLFVDLRESLMPSLLHARKAADSAKNGRMIGMAVILTVICGVLVSFVSMMLLCYRYGIRELGLDWASRTSIAVYSNIYTLVTSPRGPSEWVLIFAAIGALVMLVLVVCFHRFYWWPLHPLGYLMTYSSSMRILWFSFFLGWMANALCMRYGGPVLFKRIRLLVFGLIAGDFFMAGIWTIIGFFTESAYPVLPV